MVFIYNEFFIYNFLYSSYIKIEKSAARDANLAVIFSQQALKFLMFYCVQNSFILIMKHTDTTVKNTVLFL